VASRRTWFRFLAVLAAGLGFGYLALVAVLVGFGQSLPTAAGWSVPPLLLSAGTAVLTAGLAWGGWAPTQRQQRLQALLWATLPGLVSAIMLHALGLRPPMAILAGLLIGLVGWLPYRRLAVNAVSNSSPIIKAPASASASDMEIQISATRRKLSDPSLPPAQRAIVKFQLASALMDREVTTDNPDAPLEAAQILTELLADNELDLPTQYLAAQQLSGTKNMLAAVGGREDGWPQALDQQLALARQQSAGASRDAAVMHSYEDRAQLHMFRLSRIDQSRDVQPPEWDVELTAVLDCLERALKVAPAGAEMIPHLTMELGSYTTFRDPERGLELMRQAYEQARQRPLARREAVQYALAMHLKLRGQALAEMAEDKEELDEAVADLDEAERLATEIAEHGHMMDGHAAGILAEISQFRAQRQRS